MNRNLKIAGGIFISILALTQFLAIQQYRIAEIEQSKRLVDELNAVSERLKKTLSYSLSATSTLAFIVEKYGYPDDFASLARDILSSYDYIDALELTKQGVITDVFPLRGNEKAIGLDILNYPTASAEALEAIKRGSLFFAGPLELVQGGIAVIGRLPMYRNGQFIGFSVAIIHLNTLINAIGIDQPGSDFNYQLSKINPLTGEEDFFLTDPIDKQLENVLSVNIADGEWMLYISPTSNFYLYQQAIGYSIFGIILSVVSALLFHQWARIKDVTNIKKTEQETMKMIGRELHDNVVQLLTGASMFLQVGVEKAGVTNPNLTKVEELIRKSIGEIRMLSHDLISPFSQGETLENAVKELFEHASETAHFNIRFDFTDIKEELISNKLKTNVYRIVQEQCNNILKYADPQNVSVEINMDKDQLRVRIKDDGTGFDPEIKSNGIGFINIRSRIALFNGKIDIKSAPGKGCDLYVTFPLPEQLMIN